MHQANAKRPTVRPSGFSLEMAEHICSCVPSAVCYYEDRYSNCENSSKCPENSCGLLKPLAWAYYTKLRSVCG